MFTASPVVIMCSVRRHARPISVVLLLSLTLQACHRWVSQSQPPTAATVTEGHTIRVTLVNNTQHVLRQYRINDGMLVSEKVSIPLADIRSTEVRRFSGERTTLLALGAGLTILAVLASALQEPAPARSPTYGGGSCPVVYSWNGHEWIMDSGTFGGAIVQALQRTDLDNLDAVVPADGVLRLKLANILDETEHVDALSVLAIDHAVGTTIAPDGAAAWHTIGSLQAPRAAREFNGTDALARVQRADGWSWESALRTRDTAIVADIRDGLELTFARPQNASRAHMVIDGNNTEWATHLMTEMIRAHGTSTSAWYDTLNTFPGAARTLGARVASEAFLGVSVFTGTGWSKQGIIWEAGPEAVKRQVLEIDLAGVAGDSVRVRLESVPSFWLIDGVAMSYAADAPVMMHELHPINALDARGVNVSPSLASVDGNYYTMQQGDFAELRFAVPPVPAGQVRTYMLRTNGWYQIHTTQTNAPNIALLQQINHETFGISKAAVSRMNSALQLVSAGAVR